MSAVGAYRVKNKCKVGKDYEKKIDEIGILCLCFVDAFDERWRSFWV